KTITPVEIDWGDCHLIFGKAACLSALPTEFAFVISGTMSAVALRLTVAMIGCSGVAVVLALECFAELALVGLRRCFRFRRRFGFRIGTVLLAHLCAPWILGLWSSYAFRSGS